MYVCLFVWSLHRRNPTPIPGKIATELGACALNGKIQKLLHKSVCGKYNFSKSFMQSSRLSSAQRACPTSSRSRSILCLVKLWDVRFQFSPGPICVDNASPAPSSSCTLCWPGNNQWKQEPRGRPLFYDEWNRHLKMCMFGHFPRLGISGFLSQ